MRTSKRWTNVTFTKRVDHEAGKHRVARVPKGKSICPTCGAVQAKRRWTAGPLPVVRAASGAKAAFRPCAACRMIEEDRFRGEVRITGDFVPSHRAEIERLVRNEARRAAEDNPLARIVRLDRPSEGLRVRTTTEHLAKRIGQALHKALHGSVMYHFSHENKFAHVMWSRNRPQ